MPGEESRSRWLSGRHKLANITLQKRKRSSRRPNKNTKSKASLLDVTEGWRERRTCSNTNSGPSSLYLEKGKNGENTNLLFCFVFSFFFFCKKEGYLCHLLGKLRIYFTWKTLPKVGVVWGIIP